MRNPILSMPEIKARLARRSWPVIAISPIIAGAAVKGPAAKIMTELGCGASVAAVAEYYAGLIDGLVIDTSDAIHQEEILRYGIKPETAPILMRDITDREKLAKLCVSLVRGGGRNAS